jgi:hypothetical protein
MSALPGTSSPLIHRSSSGDYGQPLPRELGWLSVGKPPESLKEHILLQIVDEITRNAQSGEDSPDKRRISFWPDDAYPGAHRLPSSRERSVCGLATIAFLCEALMCEDVTSKEFFMT